MTAASEQEMSHADRHDLDKLARWKSGLDAAVDDSAADFPACAIFLVGPEDRASHDIFRRYRSAFEELGGGFHHLVIFGQHGVSTTQVAFLAELGMKQENVPLLAIAPMASDADDTTALHSVELPKGERDGELDESQAWGAALQAVRAAATGKAGLSFDSAPRGKACALRRGALSAAVDGVLEELVG